MESNTGKKHVKLKLVKCFSCFSDHVAVPLDDLSFYQVLVCCLPTRVFQRPDNMLDIVQIYYT